MPSLTDVYLPEAFQYTNDLTRRGSNEYVSLSHLDIGALGSHSNLPTHNPNATVCNLDDLMSLDSSVTEIVFNSAILNDPSFTVLNLTRFENVTNVVIDDESFMNVDELKLIGMNELESVVIGGKSFTKNKNSYANNPNRHFYLKNCPSLRELRIGEYSFSDYAVIEIENVNALEVIEMGDLNEYSYNFYYASLELKSILIHNE